VRGSTVRARNVSLVLVCSERKYCWLVADGRFVMREKYCWLVADKSSEQGVSLGKKDRRAGDGAEGQKWEGENDGPWEGAGADARTTGEPHTSFFS
jgi:hypothetical protein